MSRSDLCNTIQIDAFDLRRGELSPGDQATLDAHIAHCAGCRDYVERLGDMLDEATIWDPADPVPFDTNALFARIEQNIDAPDPGVTRGDDARLGSPGESWPAAPPLAGQRPPARFGPWHRDSAPGTETPRFDEQHEGHRSRRGASVAHLIITLAAALVAFLAWPLIFSTWFDNSENSEDTPAALATRNAERDLAQDAAGAASAATSRSTAGGAAAPVEPTLELEALRLFADEDARWSIAVLENGWAIDASQGTMVLEFLPTENQTLQVSFPGAQATVVGTAFYVDADEAELGVITGEVVVRSEDSPEQPVLGGSAWVEGKTRPIPPARWESITTRVDPASHRARQELAKEAARARDRAAAETPEDLEDLEDLELIEDSDTRASAAQAREAQRAGVSARAHGPATLRLEAEEAMRRRNFSAAAGHYEDLLRLLGPRDRAAATVRLDLALLYYRQLGDERRAIEHLTYFADTWPDDMAAPIAISELCRLLGESRAQSDHCGGR